MQETHVQSTDLFLIQEGSTCLRATKLVYHNYGARALELGATTLLNLCAATMEAYTPKACFLQHEATAMRRPHLNTNVTTATFKN